MSNIWPIDLPFGGLFPLQATPVLSPCGGDLLHPPFFSLSFHPLSLTYLFSVSFLPISSFLLFFLLPSCFTITRRWKANIGLSSSSSCHQHHVIINSFLGIETITMWIQCTKYNIICHNVTYTTERSHSAGPYISSHCCKTLDSNPGINFWSSGPAAVEVTKEKFPTTNWFFFQNS